jgi:site-specific DNA recombinase
MPQRKRLVAYTRRSRTGDRDATEEAARHEQGQRIDAWAERQGFEIVARLHDENVSGGTRPEDRPALARALAAVENREADGIVITATDRFSRDTTTALEWIPRLVERERLFVVDGLPDRLETADGYLNLGVHALFADHLRRKAAENFARTTATKIAQGVHISAVPPAGYLRPVKGGSLVIDEREADNIRYAFELAASGAGNARIAHELNDRGSRSGKGNPWTPPAVRSMIRNPVYLGIASGAPRAVSAPNESAHQPIVTHALWHEAQRERRQVDTRPTGENFLAGIIRCAACSHLLKPQRQHLRRSVVRTYRCHKHHTAGQCPEPTSIQAHLVEPIVDAAIRAQLDRDEYEQLADDRERREAEHALELAQDAETRWVERSGQVEDEDVYIARLNALVRDRKAAEEALHRIAPLAPQNGRATALEAWEEATPQERRDIAAALLYAVVITRPENGRYSAVADRVHLVWRGQEPGEIELPRRGTTTPPRPWPLGGAPHTPA